MEYYKDLHPQPEPGKFQLFLGILFLIIAVAFIVLEFLEGGLTLFGWIYSLILFLNGVVILLQYRGINADRIFGKKFLRITPEKICYKPSHRSKEQVISRKEVEAIHFNLSSVDIVSGTRTLTINYQPQSYQDIQKLKQILIQIAEQKGIPVRYQNQ
ncbi:MAG: hypothetical protein V2I54_04565 [Bacteroidales bacterium]|jgi:hypothetical protein|nr:hypothetical protein [Bacteroidales bacterium]